MTASSEETHVTIDRWSNTYFVSSTSTGSAATQDVFRRIDRWVAEELPGCFARSLRHRLNDANSAVWRIRRLNLNFTVDVSAAAAPEVAQTWGDRIAALIAEIIGRNAETDEVLCFANRADYLAQFATDLAAGRAWSKWYYEEFRALSNLAPGKAIAEALTREPAQGARTILHLAASGHLDEILFTLTETDARAIYEQCFGISPVSNSSQELSRWAGRLLEVWNEQPIRPASANGQTSGVWGGYGAARKNFHDALRFLARGALRFPGAEQDSVAREAVDGLLELRRVLAALRSPILADRLVRDFVQGKISLEDAIEVALQEGAVSPESGLRFLAQVSKGDPHWAMQATAVLLRDQMPPVQAAFANESMITPFGGIFLIGPALLDLNVEQVAEAAAGEGDHKNEIAGFVRLIVVAKCLGRPRFAEALADPALRLLSGKDQSHWQSWQSAFAPLDLACAQAVFARNLVRVTGCEGLCLLADVIRLTSQEKEVLLLRDLARNEWVYAAVLPHDAEAWEGILMPGLDLVSEATGNAPHLVVRRPLARLSESPALQRRVQRLHALDTDEVSNSLAEVLLLTRCISASTPLDKITRLLAPSDQELTYFSGGDPCPELDVLADLLTAVIARAALRVFARRLTGFQSSSPEHLYQNFLAGIGTVRTSAERIEVELPLSPLSIVLQMSGLTKQNYVLPWLEGIKICLAPARE